MITRRILLFNVRSLSNICAYNNVVSPTQNNFKILTLEKKKPEKESDDEEEDP